MCSLSHTLSQLLVTSFSEIGENEYIDPRTAQVAKVDHVKQVSILLFLSIVCAAFLLSLEELIES